MCDGCVTSTAIQRLSPHTTLLSRPSSTSKHCRGGRGWCWVGGCCCQDLGHIATPSRITLGEVKITAWTLQMAGCHFSLCGARASQTHTRPDAKADSIFASWRHLGVVQLSAVNARINYPTWKAEGVKAGWHSATAPHLPGRLSPGCRPQSQVSMMEWCTDVEASSSSFLSLSLGSSFFCAPKQSVQSSEIRATSGEIHILTLTPPSSSPRHHQ